MQFSTEKYQGIAFAIFWSVFDRITEDKIYVTDPQLRKQGVEFFVDNMTYSLRFEPAFAPRLRIPLFTKDEKGVITDYGWGYKNKTHATVYITRDSLNWKLYFFTAGEISEFIRKYQGDLEERASDIGYGKSIHAIYLSEQHHLSHKKPAMIPIIGEPDVSDIKMMHEYIKKYFT